MADGDLRTLPQNVRHELYELYQRYQIRFKQHLTKVAETIASGKKDGETKRLLDIAGNSEVRRNIMMILLNIKDYQRKVEFRIAMRQPDIAILGLILICHELLYLMLLVETPEYVMYTQRSGTNRFDAGYVYCLLRYKFMYFLKEAMLLLSGGTLATFMSDLRHQYKSGLGYNLHYTNVLMESVLSQSSELDVIKEMLRLREGETAETDKENLPVALSLFDLRKAGGFNTIIGQNDGIKRVQSAINNSTYSQSSPILIFYGPPGTGKTSLAAAIGIEYDYTMYTGNVTTLSSGELGGGEQIANEIFKFLEERKGNTLLFFDEADSLFPDKTPAIFRRYTLNVMIELLMNYVSAFNQNKTNKRIVALATNHIDRINKAVLDKAIKIRIDLPSHANDYLELFTYYRKVYKLNITQQRMNRLTAYAKLLRMSPSDINNFVKRLSSDTLLLLFNNPLIKVSMNHPVTSRVGNQLQLPLYLVDGKEVSEYRDPLLGIVVVQKSWDGSQVNTGGTSRIAGNVLTFEDRAMLNQQLQQARSHLPGATVPVLTKDMVFCVYSGPVEQYFNTTQSKLVAILDRVTGSDSTADPEYNFHMP